MMCLYNLQSLVSISMCVCVDLSYLLISSCLKSFDPDVVVWDVVKCVCVCVMLDHWNDRTSRVWVFDAFVDSHSVALDG